MKKVVNEAIEEQLSVAERHLHNYYYDGYVEQENDRYVLTSMLTEDIYFFR